MGDRAAQETCLLHPSLFALLAKYEFDVNLPHAQLEKMIIASYKNDAYYQNVIHWMSQDTSERPPLPPNSGHIKSRLFDPDTGDATDNGFYIHEDGLLFYENKVYIPQSVRLTILTSRHDCRTAGHLGVRKTRELVERDYWWPKMIHNIETYVTQCDKCQRAKPSRNKYSGLLHPLPIATERWKSLSMDFMVQLPLCKGYDAIMVVVD